MPFYIKAKYQNKLKKYIVNDVKQISILQIKSSFTPKIPFNLPLLFYVTSHLPLSFTTKSEHQLLQYLSTHRFQDKSTVKIEIEKQQSEQNGEPFYFDKEYNKIRSKSQEIEPELITCQFDISANGNYLAHSMYESGSLLEEIEQFISKKQNQLLKLKTQKRFTNIKSLLQFIHNKN